ncbi:MAG: hypothetical protein ABIP55_01065 [Tepidisphaeraceae bacterium]
MRKATPVAVLFSLIVIAVTCTAHAAARDAFWGTWEIIITPDADGGNAKEIKDKLTFKGDQLVSDFAKAQRIETLQYTEDTRGGIAATFKAEGKSKKNQDSMVWTGTSTGRDITGELKWTKADGSVVQYTFKGEKKS